MITVISTQHQWLFVVAVYLICFQFHTGDGTFSFLCNIECNAVVVVLHTLLTTRIVHQMIKHCHAVRVIYGGRDISRQLSETETI